LKSVSYDQKNVREGFAEGVRLFLTQPETLEARAPKVFAWLNDFADSHQYGPALKQAQADMTAWFGQDAFNRARSKIGTEKPWRNTSTASGTSSGNPRSMTCTASTAWNAT
jgi:hypothetical protein